MITFFTRIRLGSDRGFPRNAKRVYFALLMSQEDSNHVVDGNDVTSVYEFHVQCVSLDRLQKDREQTHVQVPKLIAVLLANIRSCRRWPCFRPKSV